MGLNPCNTPTTFAAGFTWGPGVIVPGAQLPEREQGMHHIFAEQKAPDLYSSGDFADGSVIVYELRAGQQKNGIISEGDRRRVEVS
jgi:hypothetical protein